MGISKSENILLEAEKNLKNIEKNERFKEKKNLVNPIVPVSQFEAFKVYEDKDKNYEERMARIEEKLKSKIKTTGIVQVYKGTAEDRFYTKTEVAELERKKLEEDAAKGIFHPITGFDNSPSPTPMSVEKSFDEEMITAEEVLLRGAKSTKDIFFELEEYRSDIYNYLREHEVSFLI